MGKGVGRIAQVVEQLTLNQRVVGSSPTAPTNKINILIKCGLTPLAVELAKFLNVYSAERLFIGS